MPSFYLKVGEGMRVLIVMEYGISVEMEVRMLIERFYGSLVDDLYGRGGGFLGNVGFWKRERGWSLNCFLGW